VESEGHDEGGIKVNGTTLRRRRNSSKCNGHRESGGGSGTQLGLDGDAIGKRKSKKATPFRWKIAFVAVLLLSLLSLLCAFTPLNPFGLFQTGNGRKDHCELSLSNQSVWEKDKLEDCGSLCGPDGFLCGNDSKTRLIGEKRVRKTREHDKGLPDIFNGAQRMSEKVVHPFLSDVKKFGAQGVRFIRDGLTMPSILAPWFEEEYRFFNANPWQRRVAYKLYKSIESLPIICPFSRVDPAIFRENVTNGLEAFGSPTEIFVSSDTDVLRFLHSQKVLNITDLEERMLVGGEEEHRKVWQAFANHFDSLLGTTSRMWIEQTLENVFGIRRPLNEDSAQPIYDELLSKLDSSDFTPMALFKRFGIEALNTAFPATGNISLISEANDGSSFGVVKPIFMPEKLFSLKDPQWKSQVLMVEEATSIKIESYSTFIQAIEKRREQFIEHGAVATFQETVVPKAEFSPLPEMEALFAAALSGRTSEKDMQRFQSHMLMEMARMSSEDGLVMQLHTGLQRDYHKDIPSESTIGPEVEIPISVDFTRGLQPLLNAYGNHPNLTLVLYTLDESTYGRELAPLAINYPSVKLGSPLWFHESPEGVQRFLGSVVPGSGIMNLGGYVDNSHHLLEVPTKHKVWRKLVADWIAKLVVEGQVKEQDAYSMSKQLSYLVPKMTYGL